MILSVKRLRAYPLINRVIAFLTYADILFLTCWGLILPFLSIFITEEVPGGTIASAGFAMTLFFIAKSLVQLPVAHFIDTHKGEKDDFFVMILGFSVIAVSGILLAFSTDILHVYVAQCLNGVGNAFAYPSWSAIFTRHLDKNREALEWSIDDTAVSFGSAVSASLGGLLITYFGYQIVFLIVSFGTMLSVIFCLAIFSDKKLYEVSSLKKQNQ